MASRLVPVALTVGALLMVAACSSDDKSGARSGGIFGGRPQSGSAGDSPQVTTSTQGTILTAPVGTDDSTMAAAADVVRSRLIRMGVTDATVTPQDDGVAVKSSADGYQLHAAAQRHATTVAAITTAAVGACNGPGTPSAGSAARCYVLGSALTGVTAVTNTAVQPASGAGWKLTFSVAADQYKAFRAALEPAGQSELALVTDDSVALAFGSGTPALQSALGPPLAEDEARRGAAALAIDSDLPVALQPPPLPPPSDARVDLDFWTAALGVNICGTWLANAPAAGLDTGVHSHGDGLIYVHPFNQSEAGDKATLGLFLQRGGWEVSADRLKLWDGDEHRSGAACPNGQAALVRWWVDGVEQHGDPTKFVPRNGQVIVLSFDSNATPPGSPPQLKALYLPALGAAT